MWPITCGATAAGSRRSNRRDVIIFEAERIQHLSVEFDVHFTGTNEGRERVEHDAVSIVP